LKYRLFIIEDNPDIGARYLEALRNSKHFEPELFPSMEEADAAAEARSPHILLADIRLEREDATEYLVKIRAGDTNFDRHIPVALFTRDVGILGEATLKRAVDQGANTLLVKGKDITPDTAAKVLSRVLDDFHENDEVIMALERIKAQSDPQTVVVLAAEDSDDGGLTIDEVILHMKLNDDFARKFKAGLHGVTLSLLQGTAPKKA